ncbi:hypothetical protein MKW98_007283 [Papaver atlanticum]|uniref:Uncharacterized protein n=1 Tax=Papaver atlanticum TaxID=357466 RepID=A0AAD4TAF7_9MAGN|nr:hypothetical protein MKW98_007283 [Papaver atlanticum]
MSSREGEDMPPIYGTNKGRSSFRKTSREAILIEPKTDKRYDTTESISQPRPSSLSQKFHTNMLPHLLML